MAYCLQCGHQAEQKIPEGDHNLRLVCPSCNYIHYENPKIICGALVIYEQKVLLCRRAIEPRYGYWTLPAGFMEIGETIAEGAARETVEEADAIAINPHLYCIYDIPDIGQIYVLYLTDLQDGKFGTGIESLECALFTEEQRCSDFCCTFCFGCIINSVDGFLKEVLIHYFFYFFAKKS